MTLKVAAMRVLRLVGYAFGAIILIVALFTATTQPSDHTRFHAVSRQNGAR